MVRRSHRVGVDEPRTAQRRRTPRGDPRRHRGAGRPTGLAATRVADVAGGAGRAAPRWSSTTSAPRTRCSPRRSRTPCSATSSGSTPRSPAAPTRSTGCAGWCGCTARPATPRAGGCGSTPGRSPSASRRSARCCAASTTAGSGAARRRRGRRGRRHVHVSRTRPRRWPRISALIDGLSVANLVYRSVSRAAAARLGRRALAARARASTRGRCWTDASGAHVTPASARRSRGRSGRGGPSGTASGRSRRPVRRAQVGEQPAERRRELEPVRRAQAHDDSRRGPAPVPSTKSRSGVRVYRQRTDRTGGPAPAASGPCGRRAAAASPGPAPEAALVGVDAADRRSPAPP